MKKRIAIALCLLMAGCAMIEPTHPSLMELTKIMQDSDMDATLDDTNATYVDVENNSGYTITDAGVYVFTGSANDYTITVDAQEEVWIVLDNTSIVNEDSPAIDIKNAAKAYVYSTGDNHLETTTKDCPIEADCDIVLCGNGALRLNSQESCVKSDATVAFVSGTYELTSAKHGIKADNAIIVVNANISIISTEDGLHAENSEDDTLGYVYIGSGKISIQSSSDAIHAGSLLQVDGGEIDLDAWEGMEATVVQVNGGNVSIHAVDDAINAGKKSKSYKPLIEINGGTLTIVMAEGDNDAMDSNSDISINGGTVDITCGHNPFDYLGNASFTGGELIVNGAKQTQIIKQKD